MFDNSENKTKVELFIHAIARTSSDDSQSVLRLKEKKGERILPIITTYHKAVRMMAGSQIAEFMLLPMSPADIGSQLMKKFGIRLTSVELTSLQDGKFICAVRAERDGEVQSLDFCKAEDALIMAISAGCPIMIDEKLLEAQYMHPTGENSFALNISTLSRQMLEDALKYAVENEKYEIASRLRDELAKRNATNA